MKLMSFAVAACRHFSSFKTKNWSKDYLFNKKKGGGGSKALKRPKIKLTDQQQKILDAVCNGQSVFLTGSAGTGKTFLLEHIIKKLKQLHGHSCVYVTAATGVAACALKGQTLHSFAGIGCSIGYEDCNSLLKRVLWDKRACNRWRKVKALIIDEISMVEAALFDGLAYIARNIKHGEASVDKPWGGIQLIVSGDFFQLPPVKKGSITYAFEADCWKSSFDLQIDLNTIFRQSDALLIQWLQGIRKGENDTDLFKLIEGCCSGNEPDPSAVLLYPTNDDVEKVNIVKMESLVQKIHVYNAEDLGEKKWMRQLHKGIAPAELKLCVGARVMLIRNKKHWLKLVNGSTGTVIEFREVPDKQYELSGICNQGNLLPVVKFDSGLEYVVEPEIWVVMDGDKVVAMRRQIPLILSWALSIHKCQGMTIEKLHTDLSRVFGYGMVYVALSRVKSLAGLQFCGLDPSKIMAHPRVLEFYRDFKCGQRETKNI